MSAGLQHVVLYCLGLAAAALVARLALALLRKEPVAAYRLLVLLLGALVLLPLLQVGLERGASELGLELPEPLRVARAELARRLGDTGARVATGRALAGDVAPAALRDATDALPTLLAFDPGSRAPELAVDAESAVLPAPAPRGLSAAALLAGVYALGAAVFLVRTLARVHATRRLLARAVPVDDERVLAEWKRASRGSPLAERVTLCSSPELRTPACFDLGRPVVVLPADAALPERPDVLRFALVHELVHLERKDTWVALLQELGAVALWFHPAFWWLSRRLDALRELSCDELVVRRSGSRRSYATALLEYAATALARGGRPTSLPLVPWSRSPKQLQKRIQMLVATRTRSSRRARSAAALAGGLLALVFGSQLTLAAALGAQSARAPFAPTPAPGLAQSPAFPPALAPLPSPLAQAPFSPAPAPAPRAAGRGAPRAAERVLGISFEPASPALAAQIGLSEGELLVVTHVFEDTPAQRGGLEQWDVITHVNGEPATNARFRAARDRVAAGEPLRLRVQRRGKALELEFAELAEARSARRTLRSPEIDAEQLWRSLDFYEDATAPEVERLLERAAQELAAEVEQDPLADRRAYEALLAAQALDADVYRQQVLESLHSLLGEEDAWRMELEAAQEALEGADEARRDADDVRREAADQRREAQEARREAEEALREGVRIRRRPAATEEAQRAAEEALIGHGVREKGLIGHGVRVWSGTEEQRRALEEAARHGRVLQWGDLDWRHDAGRMEQLYRAQREAWKDVDWRQWAPFDATPEVWLRWPFRARAPDCESPPDCDAPAPTPPPAPLPPEPAEAPPARAGVV